MAYVGNMILETSASPGTSTTINLAGAVAGRSTIRSQHASGSTVGYMLSNATAWEAGEGVLTHGTPDTLTRTTVLSNSLGTTARIDFSGSTFVSNVIPAERIPYVTAAGALTIAGLLTSGSVSTGGITSSGSVSVTGAITAANGTATTQVVNYSQFAPSSAASYHSTKLPGGLRLIVGSGSGTPTGTPPNGSLTITFPASSFSSQPIVVVSNGSASSNQTRVNLTGGNASQFVVSVPDWTAGDVTVNYTAMGAA